MAETTAMQPPDSISPPLREDERRQNHISDPPVRQPTMDHTSRMRHSKKMSLNFPVLPALQPQQTVLGLHTTSPVWSHSSGTLTPTTTTVATTPSLGPSEPPAHHSAGSGGSKAVHAPTMTPPDEEVDLSSVDFLTLIAAQERKVLELREEMQKAEAELKELKRQWALGEAKRKTAEVKAQAVKMKRLSSGGSLNKKDADAYLAGETPGVERDAEREKIIENKRKALMERRGSHSVMNTWSDAGGPGPARHVPRRSQPRVFSGSRHARTLSLLSTPGHVRKGMRTSGLRISLDETGSPTPHHRDGEGGSATNTAAPPLTRADMLPTETDGTFGFGKTYRNLANRRSMPPLPPTAEVMVRQGQKVAEGLREGLWSLFEDIRQATVGEEGINGTSNARTAPTTVTAAHPKRKSTARKPSTPSSTSKGEMKKETNFWREFGLDTPNNNNKRQGTERPLAQIKQGQSSTTTTTTATGDLIDLDDDDDDDNDNDEWEPWESPVPPDTLTGTKADLVLPGWPDLSGSKPDPVSRDREEPVTPPM